MKVSDSPCGLTESYVVRFWCTNDQGFYRQVEETLYANSKSAHKEIEKFAIKNLGKVYKNIRIIGVYYQ